MIYLETGRCLKSCGGETVLECQLIFYFLYLKTFTEPWLNSFFQNASRSSDRFFSGF